MSAETLQRRSVYVRSDWEQKPLMRLVLPSETRGSHLVGWGMSTFELPIARVIRLFRVIRVGYWFCRWFVSRADRYECQLFPAASRIATE